MTDLSFTEWVKQKAERADSEQARRRGEWIGAYRRLRALFELWLKEDGDGQIQIVDFEVMRNEQGLGFYHIKGFNIFIGDSSVKVEPVGRNVIARINPPVGGEFPGEGRVDISGGGRKYHLYRTIQDGEDRWYVVDERRHPLADRAREPDLPLTRELFEQILMDLMS